MFVYSILLQLDFLESVQIRTIFLGCSVLGGAVLGLQMLLLLFGGDVGSDTDIDDLGDGSDGMGFLSIRSMASVNLSGFIRSNALLQSKKHMQTGCFVASARSAILLTAASGSEVLLPARNANCCGDIS